MNEDLNNEMAKNQFKLDTDISEKIDSINATGDDDFIKNEDPDKNSTKVIIDTDHNKALIDEMKTAISTFATTNDGLKNITPVPVPVPTTVESNTLSIQKDVKSDGTTEFVDTESIEKSEEFLSRIDNYVNHPEDLRFTEDEIKYLKLAIGKGNESSINIITAMMDDDIKKIQDGILLEKEHPESVNAVQIDKNGVQVSTDEMLPNLANPLERRKLIEDCLKIKISAEELIKSSKELTDPVFINKIFAAKYPKYIEQGPAWIVDGLAKYLDSRFKNKQEYDFLVEEINNTKKLNKVFKHGENEIFKCITTSKGKPYKIGNFIMALLKWNKSIIAEEYGLKEEDVNIKNPDIQSLMVILSFLIIRYLYKYVIPNMVSNAFECKLFYHFVMDNIKPNEMGEDKEKMLTNAWKIVIRKCHFIAVDASRKLEIKNK